MIVSILYSSPTFEAVDYNERKVANGVASLLVAENMGYLEEGQQHSANQLRQQLIDYSSQNERITKPQMHVAFSCRGDEMNNDELVDFARKWLKEMGYADPKQPLLIYSHNDTNNNHIHVITSRVDPQGKKINHNHERVRSKAFVEKTLGVDTRAELNKAVIDALGYRFSSIGEWKAIMEAKGYDIKQEGEVIKIARNGAYQATFPFSSIMDKTIPQDGKIYGKRQHQIKAWLLKYRDLCCSKEELQQQIKKNFGLDLVFFGEENNPRGYFIIDHQNKQVVKGSKVLKLSTLLQIKSYEEKMRCVEATLDGLLEMSPRLTPVELNSHLRKHYNSYYCNGTMHYNGIDYVLPKYMQDALEYNLRLEKVSHFAFSDTRAKEALCAYFEIKSNDVPEGWKGIPSAKQKTILEGGGETTRYHIKHIRWEGQIYAIDLDNKVITFAKQEQNIGANAGIDTIQDPKKSIVPSSVVPQKKRDSQSHNTINREWEVGKSGYDEYDDARRLKR